jgi:hypothetical protein
MSEVKVNKISPRTNCGTVQLGDSGDTITIPAGATITNNGTAAGFGATGAASWDTTVKTASFTGVAGVGYFVNTTSGAITVTLPASPDAGAVIAVKDYANTFDTNNVTLARNGSNIGGQAIDATLSTEGLAVTLVYVDATKGWLVTDDGLQSSLPQPAFITATGGTVTCCGDYKIHTFTSPGTFCVSCAGNPAGSDTVDYLVVAGGGGGGSSGNNDGAGAGGGGGFRVSSGTASGCYGVSPLGSCVPALPVSAQGYPITVGGGGAGGGVPSGPGANGANSVFSTITSAGGGKGAAWGPSTPGSQAGDGGSGGGGSGFATSPASTWSPGSGNTPPVSPPQGNNGGRGTPAPAGAEAGGGGGGAGAVGVDGGTNCAGNGGIGSFSDINPVAGIAPPGPSPAGRYYSGGGGGGMYGTPPSCAGVGQTGGGPGGKDGSPPNADGVSGTANSGGGGGGAGGYSSGPVCSLGGAGGSGIVIIRYKFQ